MDPHTTTQNQSLFSRAISFLQAPPSLLGTKTKDERVAGSRLVGEQGVDLLALEGAAVAHLAGVDVLGELADLGGGGELELGVLHAHVVLEEGQDDIVVRLGQPAGGQVADQAAVALGGLNLGNECEGGVLDLGGALAAAARSQSQTSDGSNLQDGKTAKSQGSSATAGEANGAGAGNGSTGGEEDGVASTAHGSEGGDSENDLGVHAGKP